MLVCDNILVDIQIFYFLSGGKQLSNPIISISLQIIIKLKTSIQLLLKFLNVYVQHYVFCWHMENI